MSKLDNAKRAADELFSDTSVDRDTTRKLLEELVEHIEIALDTLRDDQRS